ncbi:MAG TPA: peptide chain release factor N(5)-glutamine methyltransferase, partial [Rhizomicrobium sp.]|nr:peptide chain release factor N(5)-glutamine methyltransferase [Rhizomicrobium sp.]
TDDLLKEFEQFIARRIAREPVAYIVGKKGFWDLEFDVGPGALVPRPETETLIEQALKRFPDRSAALEILDLGTGTGCLLLTLLHLYPNATGLGVDSSPEALGWAKRNAQKLGLESRCALRLADWAQVKQTGFDLMVTNPPYLSRDDLAAAGPELAHEPVQALFGGPDGLDTYRAIAPLLPRLLAPKGCAILEIGKGQGEAVSAILRAAGLEIERLAPDLSGIPRCVMARAMAQKTVGNPRPSR